MRRLTTLAVLLLVGLPSVPQAANSKTRISVEELGRIGLHLPASMSLKGQIDYQTNLARHQELDVLWDVAPGAPARIREEEVPNWPKTARFEIQRKREVNGPIWKTDLEIPGTIYMIACTPLDEIRSITSTPDIRYSGAEHGEGGFYNTKVTLQIQIPIEPGITQIVVLEGNYAGQVWHLEPLGTIPLGDH